MSNLLMNYGDSTITEGYQELSMDRLRGELGRVTAFPLGREVTEVPEGETEPA